MQKDNGFIEIPPKFMDRVIGNYNPVVIITTRNANGESNAAPFAMCMEVCHNPPLLAFSVGHSKDTYNNVKASGEFIVNVPGEDILRNLIVTAIRYPPEINELVEARLDELPGLKVNVNRIKECQLHFECVVEWTKEAGKHFIVLGKVVAATGNKEVLTDDYRLKFESLKPVHYVGRGTDTFLETGKLVKVKREPFKPGE
jgi:flavin reductase (DIM6/NTAB) family NADH-FMN oxidoreductase RutF